MTRLAKSVPVPKLRTLLVFLGLIVKVSASNGAKKQTPVSQEICDKALVNNFHCNCNVSQDSLVIIEAMKE